MTKIEGLKIVEIPKIADYRGNISVIEKDILPYKVKRVYYMYDIPSGSKRGGHAHIEQSEFLIALSGSFDVVLNNGLETVTVNLNRPDKGLLIPKGVWRELDSFSAGAVCLVLASDVFDEADYIRDYNQFKDCKTTQD